MSALAGAGVLLRAAARRDRVLVPGTVALFTAFVAASVSATAGLYPDRAALAAAADAINNTPALVALYGRIHDPWSLGAVSLVKLTSTGTALVATVAVLLTVRHTRADEEAGRQELAVAAAAGRLAPLAAAVAATAGALAALGALTVAALLAGGAGLPAGGALAFGAAWAATGWFFAGVAAVAAQVTRDARSARGAALALLGAAFLLRAVGDSAGPGWLSWLSPLGWAQQVRPFAGERWWVLALPLAAGAALVAAAVALARARDLGAGLVPERAGPGRAGAGLRGAAGLAWRQGRGALAGWLAGFAVLSAVLGTVASTIGQLLDSPQAREWIAQLGGEGALADAFLSAEMTLMAMMSAAFGVHLVLALRAQEVAGTQELALGAGAPRRRWLAAHLVVAAAATGVLTGAVGLSAGVAHALQVGDASRVGAVVAAAAATLPAQWVVLAAAAAAFGLRGGLAPAGWFAFGGAVLVTEFAALLRLPWWVADLSPFTHVPRLPGGSFEPLATVVLLAVAGALAAAAAWAFSARDAAP